MEIKKKNRERANKRWGQMGALDRERWQEIENLANSAIQDAKEHLVRALRVERSKTCRTGARRIVRAAARAMSL